MPAPYRVALPSAERRRAWWGAACFFTLLAGYYVLRPVRDAMGIEGGVDDLPWLYTGTFVAILVAVPLVSALVARLRRRIAVPVVYAIFVVDLVVFAWLVPRVGPQAKVTLARVIYVWISVFNMFAVSLLWAVLADVFSTAQSKRQFGLVAAGGSAGAIAGPLVAATLAESLGPAMLLMLAAGLVSLAALGIAGLGRSADGTRERDAAVGGRWWEGASRLLRSPSLRGIAAYVVLTTTVSTFLYFEQAKIVAAAIEDGAARTRLFAQMDLATNVLALSLQSLGTAALIRRFGVPSMLLCLPVLGAVGFGALAVAPVLGVLVVVQVVKRAANFAIGRPAREILFTGVDPTERYQSKLVIDTVVYRGGDMLSAWAFTGLVALGLGLGPIALLGIPVALLWGRVARYVGRQAAAARTEA